MTTTTTAPETSGSYRIESLKGAENYITWRVQLEDILSDLGLWEYTSGGTLRPADAAQAVDWAKKDRKALTTIRLRVSNAMMTHVISATTSKDAFDALSNVFNTEGTIARVTLRRRLFRYTMEEGADMDEEIRKIKGLWQELVLMTSNTPAVNVTTASIYTDNELAMIILTALPASWDPFVSSMGADANLKSSDLIGRILQEDSRRKDRATTDTSLVTTGPRMKSKFRAGVFCHACGKEGHIRPECRSSSNKGRDIRDNRDKRNTRAHIAEHDDESDEPDEFVFHVTDEGLESYVTTEDLWLGDTGSQSHIVRDRSLFTRYTEAPGNIQGAGNCPSLGRGDVRIYFNTKSGRVPITLKDAIHAPSMKYNLISLGRLTSAGLSYEGIGDTLTIKHGAKTIGHGRKSGYLYRISVSSIKSTIALAARTTRSWYEWHCALGHINKFQLRELAQKKLVKGMDLDSDQFQDFECDACVQAKHTRQAFPKASTTKYQNVGDIIYSDIWGPIATTSLQGNKYMITFTDGSVRWVWTDYMKTRDEALSCYKKVEEFLWVQFKVRIKILHVDNALEYTRGKFKAYLDTRGTILQPTAPYSPQQNGPAERLNRTILERTRAMLIAHQLPSFLWQEASSYMVYLKNRSPTRALPGKTPYEGLNTQKPDIQNIQEFGVDCWVLTQPKEKVSKLDAKSQKFVFTGISEGSTSWRYYSAATRQILTSRDVIF